MIKTLTLIFPDGISMKDAQAVAIEAEKVTMMGVSQGGYKCLNPSNLYFEDGPVEWDESHAEFIHSYNRSKTQEKP